MKWGWDPNRWQRWAKVLLGIATVWPPVYLVLFIVIVFSFMFALPFSDQRGSGLQAQEIDLLQLYRKIDKGEIRSLRITDREVRAVDRLTNVEYRAFLTDESIKQEILKAAQETDASGQPRVASIAENPSQPPAAFLPFGFAALFAAHFITILLILGLMPLYIILAVKSDRLDQTMRIIWVVLICMLGMLAMPAYWYLYVWRRAPLITPVATPEVPS